MPFIIAPARHDDVRGFLFDPKANLRCFYSKDVATWVIVDTDHLTPIIKVDDSESWMCPFLYNGSSCWSGSGGTIFNSVTDGWILLPYGGFDEPAAEKDLDGTTWIGDAWWRIGTPNPDYPELFVEPRGRFLNEDEAVDPPVVTWWWQRWQWESAGRSRTPWGTYIGKDGAEAIAAKRILGSQQYQDNNRRSWILAQDRQSLTCSDGRIIRYVEDEDLWICGVKGMGKWWQSATGPDRDEGMTLAPWKHDAESGEDMVDPDGTSIVLTFYAFVATEGKDQMYMAEVALWR